jgi:cytochrome c oxidase subunit 2
MLATFSDYLDLNKLMGILPNMSEHGKEIDHMLNFCHWFMLVLFVGWTSYFIFCMIRFRQGRNPKADHHGIRNHVSTHIEASVVIIEAVILLGFGIPLWGKRVNEIPDQDKADALKIRAMGFQFGWRIHYAGPDGKFGRQHVRFIQPGVNDLGLDPEDENGRDDAVVTSDMHLIDGKATVIRVSSLDVIHGFALHQMRVQQDAIPGTEAPMWFRPVQKGNWQIICAQLCGEGHPGMVATYSCESKEDFDSWYGTQRDITQNKLKSQAEEMKKEAEKAKAEAEKGGHLHGGGEKKAEH